MSNVEVGDLVEILKIGHFNCMFVTVGDVAEVIRVDGDQITLNSTRWEHSQLTQTYREGGYWRLLPTNSSTPTVEPPTITSEPFITIKGVDVGSSLERALNLVVAVCNGEDIVDGNGLIVSCSSTIKSASYYLCGIVSDLNDNGLGWYTLKSEEEVKLSKEALDKEIQELEDKLQALKTKRGD